MNALNTGTPLSESKSKIRSGKGKQEARLDGPRLGGFIAALSGLLTLLLYLPVLIRHKLGVLLAGQRLNSYLAPTTLGVPLRRLIFHDWPKFGRAELGPYARHFRKRNLETTVLGRTVRFICPNINTVLPDPEIAGEWETALRHHHSLQDHHPEYWLEWAGRTNPPDAAFVEMAADLLAASWGYEGRWPNPGEWSWLQDNWHNIRFPTARSRAVFVASLSCAGYQSCFPTPVLTEVRAHLRQNEVQHCFA